MNVSDCYFTREFQLDCCDTPLILHQKEVGGVNSVVWDAALVLAKYLEVRSFKLGSKWISGKNVFEIGAGLGCVGLTAACLGANVVMTDLPEAMDLLEKNIMENKNVFSSKSGKATAEVLEWGSAVDTIVTKPHILLVADCIYYEESIVPLVETISLLTDDNTEILLSQEERISERQIKVWEKFQNMLKQNFFVTRIPETEQHKRFSSSDICVMSIKKKNMQGVNESC